MSLFKAFIYWIRPAILLNVFVHFSTFFSAYLARCVCVRLSVRGCMSFHRFASSFFFSCKTLQKLPTAFTLCWIFFFVDPMSKWLPWLLPLVIVVEGFPLFVSWNKQKKKIALRSHSLNRLIPSNDHAEDFTRAASFILLQIHFDSMKM